MRDYHLAQANIAKMLAPIDSLIMADFMNNLDRINALAEQSSGFIWRMKEENNNAMEIKVFDDDFIVINMSVWESSEALFDFTYRSEHVEIFKRKKEWFHKMKDMHMALWYIPSGHIPSTDEAKERLNYLNINGETPFAFNFKSKFSSDDASIYLPQP